MLRVVFMGSPDFAVPSLRAVLERHQVCLVVTKPDKPAGRGKKTATPIVKTVADEAGVPTLQPRSARGPELAAALAAANADIGVVVAYGKILPLAVLEAFPHGCVNVHASLLPAYRGAAPIQWAVINGDRESGVSIMRLDEGMDEGPVFCSRSVPLAWDETSGSLFSRLAPLGAETLLQVLAEIEAGTAEERAQDSQRATYAPMLDKSAGFIDWTRDCAAVANLVRGVDPWPGAVAELDGQRVKLFAPRVVDGAGNPGEVLQAGAAGLVVACGTGAIRFAAIQAPGRKRISVADFVRGRQLPKGSRFGRVA